MEHDLQWEASRQRDVQNQEEVWGRQEGKTGTFSHQMLFTNTQWLATVGAQAEMTQRGLCSRQIWATVRLARTWQSPAMDVQDRKLMIKALENEKTKCSQFMWEAYVGDACTKCCQLIVWNSLAIQGHKKINTTILFLESFFFCAFLWLDTFDPWSIILALVWPNDWCSEAC